MQQNSAEGSVTLNRISEGQMRKEVAAMRAGKTPPKRRAQKVHYNDRPEQKPITLRKETAKKTDSLLDKMIKSFGWTSERYDEYQRAKRAISPLFTNHKLNPTPEDAQNMFGYLEKFPYYDKAKGHFKQEGTKEKFAQKMLDRDHEPAIRDDFWLIIDHHLSKGRIKGIDRNLPTIWDAYETNVQELSSSSDSPRVEISEPVVPTTSGLPQRRRGRPPAAQPRTVHGIKHPKPFDLPKREPGKALQEIADNLETITPGDKELPLRKPDLSTLPPPPPTGEARAFGVSGGTEAKTSLFARSEDERRQAEAKKLAEVKLPENWELRNNQIVLPDGKRIAMDPDTLELAIINTKASGVSPDLILVERAKNRAGNKTFLKSKFPELSDGVVNDIVESLQTEYFGRKLDKLNSRSGEDNFEGFKEELARSAINLAKAQKRAEKLIRSRSAKSEFESAQEDYYQLQKHYLEAIARQHEGEPDTAERDAAMFAQIIGMNQAVEDAKGGMLKGARAKFRQFWQKHPKSRVAVGVALAGVGVASAAVGFVPGAIGAALLKKGLGAYGTYVGTENAFAGLSQISSNRAEKRSMQKNAKSIAELEESDPAMAEKIYGILDKTKDHATRALLLSNLSAVSEYLAEPTSDNELHIFEKLVDAQQKKLSAGVKNTRLGKGLAVFTSVLVTSVGIIPWHHEVNPIGGQGKEIGRTVGKHTQEQVQSKVPTSIPASPIDTSQLPPGIKPKLTTEQLQKAKEIFGDWTPAKNDAFNNMYKILGQNPSAEQIARFNNLFPVS